MDNSKTIIEMENNYTIISLSEITDEARSIAIEWAESVGLQSIWNKHKLASDIMNYAINYHKAELEKLNAKPVEFELPQKWSVLDVIPPDVLVEVIDAAGNQAIARPVYSSLSESGTLSWGGKFIIHSKPDLLSTIGKIVGWRHIHLREDALVKLEK